MTPYQSINTIVVVTTQLSIMCCSLFVVLASQGHNWIITKGFDTLGKKEGLGNSRRSIIRLSIHKVCHFRRLHGEKFFADVYHKLVNKILLFTDLWLQITTNVIK